MLVDCIHPNQSGYFSKLILDYLNENEAIKPLYNRFPNLENFKDQITEKQKNYSDTDRAILIDALKKQYQGKEISEETKQNIEKLQNNTTFTITTGHQLNLFSGPVYYLYKILSVINLSEQLKSKYQEYDFVPVFWMATEDHDFEEINNFKFRDKKIVFSTDEIGPVGRFKTKGLEKVYQTIDKEFGTSTRANYLKNIFKKAYLENDTLADATFFLTNEIFKKFGILIVNGDCSILKSNFREEIKNEIFNNTLYNNIESTLPLLKDYHTQVNPREINLFYIKDGLRERIIKENETYKINNTKLSFSNNKILDLINKKPEEFSPNAIFRPVYQETVLPNLAYVGGGGELAYWLELKSGFKAFNKTFPILIHRDSVLLVSKKLDKKIQKLNLTYSELFLNATDLNRKKTIEYSNLNLDFTDLKNQLINQFKTLEMLAQKTNKNFETALQAQRTKQINGLDKLQKRLLNAEEKSLHDKLNRIISIKDELFVNNSLQERNQNFSEFYIDSDNDLIHLLKTTLNPLQSGFKIIII